MITEIIALLSSGPIGALIGGGLAIWQRRNDLEAKRIDNEHERNRWVHELGLREWDLKQVQAEAAGRREVAVIEGDARAEVSRNEAIARAQAADRITADELRAAGKWGRFFLAFTLIIQRLVRPLLTVTLVGTALWLNVELLLLIRGRTWSGLQPQQQLELGMQALAWATGQASAVVQYWFVSRGTGK